MRCRMPCEASGVRVGAETFRGVVVGGRRSRVVVVVRCGLVVIRGFVSGVVRFKIESCCCRVGLVGAGGGRVVCNVSVGRAIVRAFCWSAWASGGDCDGVE